MRVQNTDGIKLLMSSMYVDEKDKTMREYALRYLTERSKSEQLMSCLKEQTSATEFKTVMDALCRTMKHMIQQRMVIVSDVFNLCWLYDSSQLSDVMFAKCKQLLNMQTLSSRPNDWKREKKKKKEDEERQHANDMQMNMQLNMQMNMQINMQMKQR
ncbi:hypothetical protein RFI_01369 [Reticulomyxa filosa]|uniref:Uncharacterized protein n=1 Tax=Reticulomyxa filosa TaxID=46433 RepID=X6PDE2_RETFI|nr:hypothetical protein RFI_01369 [Reticulomyxa filosa]|eukprot:ETO35692.1 hypothetical protein RFI_01369 [Reticulomyxa filosa]